MVVAHSTYLTRQGPCIQLEKTPSPSQGAPSVPPKCEWSPGGAVNKTAPQVEAGVLWMGWQSELIRDKRTANKLFCCRERLTGFAAGEQLSMNNPHKWCKQCSNYNLHWIYMKNPLFLCLSFVMWHRPAVFALTVHRLLYLTFRRAWFHVAEEPDVRADGAFIVAAAHNMPLYCWLLANTCLYFYHFPVSQSLLWGQM